MVGQAGRRDVSGVVTVNTFGSPGAAAVSIPGAIFSDGAKLFHALEAVAGLEIVHAEVVEHLGDDANDNGLSRSTGYGVGPKHVLSGLGKV